MNLALSGSQPSLFPPTGETLSYFVGATSPRGHMLPTVIGAHKLQKKAQELGAEAIVVDTTGLVSRAEGGGALKHWKIELLEPSVLMGLARGSELEHILWPWRWDKRVRVYDLPVAEYAVEKARAKRITNREEKFVRYFQKARTLTVPFRQVVVFGMEMMAGGRLLAFQDDQGLAVALGVATAYDRKGQELSVITPLPSLEGVSSIRFGSLKLDPTTGQELKSVNQ
jgi:polynucleotide 5'-hydroxyl-kinase GRC3/NOL9